MQVNKGFVTITTLYALISRIKILTLIKPLYTRGLSEYYVHCQYWQ